MSEIPYYFETPIPKYFREAGWFDDPKTILFVHWAFSRCSTKPYKLKMNRGNEVTVQPFEFLAGRLSNPKECFLTEKEFRGQLFRMLNAGILKKGANSRANTYTFYTWVVERFSQIEGQQKGQLRANRGPTEGHNLDIRRDISEDISNIVDAQPAAQLRTKDLLSFNFEKWEFEGISEKDIATWKLIYPHIDLKIELMKASQWLKTNPSKSKKTLWRKYLTGWFTRANETADNKKAFRTAAGVSSHDRRTQDIHGNPVKSPHDGRF